MNTRAVPSRRWIMGSRVTGKVRVSSEMPPRVMRRDLYSVALYANCAVVSASDESSALLGRSSSINATCQTDVTGGVGRRGQIGSNLHKRP
jgi:hypothetical protein